MKILRKSFASCVVLCVSSWASQKQEAKNSWKFFTIDHKTITIDVVVPKQSSSLQTYAIKRLIQDSIAHVEQKNQGTFEESFGILFDSRPAFHNGLATIIPRNFIWIYTTPPLEPSSISFSRDYLKSTVVHELGHMFYLQKKSSLFRAGHWVFGNLSSPLGSWPRWMHEGWATWVEERHTKENNLSYLNMLKRAYTEHLKRHPHHPLTTSQLEGNKNKLHAVDGGELPYAFGHDMMEGLFSKINPNDWSHKSSSSLGISFRKILQDNPKAFDELFLATEANWRSQEPNVETPTSKTILKSDKITALFEDAFIFNEDGSTFVGSVKNHKKRGLPKWSHHHWHLAGVAKIPGDSSLSDHYLMAYYSRSPHGMGATRLRISIFLKNRSAFIHKCTALDTESQSFKSFGLDLDSNSKHVAVELIERNIFARQAKSTPDNFHYFIDSECGATPAQQKPSLQTLNATNSQTIRWMGPQASDEIKITAPRLAPTALCSKVFNHSSEGCLTGVLPSPESQDPVLLSRHKKTIWYKKISTATGATHHSLQELGSYWIEKKWDFDELKHISTSELQKLPSKRWIQDSSPIALQDHDHHEILSVPYKTIHTLRPHYWMPRLYATQGGAIISGTSWFHDITKTTEGTVDLGYDTVSKFPYAQVSVSNKIHGFDFFEAAHVSASYYRDTTLGFSVDQSAFGLGSYGESEVTGSTIMALKYNLGARKIQTPQETRFFLVPSQTISLSYKEPSSNQAIFTDFSEQAFGIHVSARQLWIQAPEFYTQFSVSHKNPISWNLHLEHGYSSKKNLPYSYFEWGGAYPLSLAKPSFVSRGFAPRMAPTTHVARAAMTGGWKLFNNLGGAGWSRLEIEKVSQDIFVETVSFDFISTKKSELFKNHYSSVGTELNFWVRSFFYVNSRAYIGIYKGFGTMGELRTGVGFSSNLDI